MSSFSSAVSSFSLSKLMSSELLSSKSQSYHRNQDNYDNQLSKIRIIMIINYHEVQMTFDSTGCFHWCSSRAVEECTMTRQEVVFMIIIIILVTFFVLSWWMETTSWSEWFQATVTMFSGHIIVAIFAEPDSPLLGLRFVFCIWSICQVWCVTVFVYFFTRYFLTCTNRETVKLSSLYRL